MKTGTVIALVAAAGVLVYMLSRRQAAPPQTGLLASTGTRRETGSRTGLTDVLGGVRDLWSELDRRVVQANSEQVHWSALA